MTGGQWEVVGGKTKKSKSKDNVSKIPKKEKIKESAPFEVSGPICESQTIYTAFLEKEKKEPPPKQKVSGNDVSKHPEKNAQKKKKDKDKKSPVSKLSLENVFALVMEEDVKNHLATVQVLCPDSPLLWLKDLTSYLNLKLDVPVEDLTFASKPLGYPSLLLNKKVRQMIMKLFNKCTPQMLQLFYEFCLQAMVQDILKGLHTVGYRVMLQCLSHEMPSIALANLSKCFDLCISHQNRQNICLSVLWAAGQFGNNDLEAGFKVWLDLMFPLIGTKNCTNYAVEYLEKLVSGDDVTKCNKSLFSVREFFPLLDFVYSKELVKSVQKKVMTIYPTLKILSYGPEPETVLRNYFPSYLRRLEPQCQQPLRDEILSSLMYCLEKDTRCYSVWRQLYTKHFTQSKLLIAYINEQWEKLPPKFPKSSLRNTLSTFQVTNEELFNSNKRNNEVEECIAINKDLLSKLNSTSFSWLRFMLVVIFISGLLLLYDILSHGSFAESMSGKLMKDSGFLVFCAQAGDKLAYFYGKMQKLSEKYFPIIAKWSRKTLLPFLELSMKKLSNVLVLIWDTTFGLRTWCNENLPSLLLVVENHISVYGTALLNNGKYVMVLLSKSALFALEYLVVSADSFAVWIQSNAEIMHGLEVVKSSCVLVAENIQQNAIHLFQLAKSYFPA